ncbi:23S rRNA (uracil-5-)-methyltransferase RumA, partial [Staphylococcus sp. SIMBA_130]
MDTCSIQAETINEILPVVRQLANQLGIEPYQEENHCGDLRHIMIRTGHATNDVMIVLVTRT